MSKITKQINKVTMRNSGNSVNISCPLNKVTIRKGDTYCNTITVRPPGAKCYIRRSENKVSLTKIVNKITISGKGVQGIPGPAGDVANVVNTYTAGEPINAYKVVKLETDGLLYLADKDTPGDIYKIIGISISSGSASAPIQVLEKGYKANSLLNGFTDGIAFLANSGNLSNAVPTSGFCYRIGFFPKSGEIYLQLSNGIILN